MGEEELAASDRTAPEGEGLAVVRELLAEGFTEEEIVRVLVDENGFDEVSARELIDVELGRSDGDRVRLGG